MGVQWQIFFPPFSIKHDCGAKVELPVEVLDQTITSLHVTATLTQVFWGVITRHIKLNYPLMKQYNSFQWLTVIISFPHSLKVRQDANLSDHSSSVTFHHGRLPPVSGVVTVFWRTPSFMLPQRMNLVRLLWTAFLFSLSRWARKDKQPGMLLVQ